AVALLFVLALAAGCFRPGRGSVSGVVTYQGKPLPGGTILFYDEKNRVREADIREDGTYVVTDVATGTARVAVVTPTHIPMVGPGGFAAPGRADAPKPRSVQIPAKYGSPDSSGLRLPVGRGENKFDVDL